MNQTRRDQRDKPSRPRSSNSSRPRQDAVNAEPIDADYRDHRRTCSCCYRRTGMLDDAINALGVPAVARQTSLRYEVEETAELEFALGCRTRQLLNSTLHSIWPSASSGFLRCVAEVPEDPETAEIEFMPAVSATGNYEKG